MQNDLTEKQRTYLTAYVFEGLSTTQIAQREGVNRSTAWRQIVRAQEKLKYILKYVDVR